MNIQRKIEIVEQAVRSIAEHSDADSTVLLAALGRCGDIVTQSADSVRARAERETREALGTTVG